VEMFDLLEKLGHSSGRGSSFTDGGEGSCSISRYHENGGNCICILGVRLSHGWLNHMVPCRQDRKNPEGALGTQPNVLIGHSLGPELFDPACVLDLEENQDLGLIRI